MKRFIIIGLFTLFFSTSIVPNTFAFTDEVPEYVEELASYGFFSEEEYEKEFKGNSLATRSDIIRWIMFYQNIETEQYANSEKIYTDIPSQNNLFGYVHMAFSIGAFDNWHLNQKLLPKKKITTLDALSFLLRIENIPVHQAAANSDMYQIEDLPKNPKDRAVIITAIQNEMIIPSENNLVFPNKKLTKSELAYIIYNFYTSLNKEYYDTEYSDYDTIQSLIKNNYLYNANINMDDINDQAFQAMVNALNDPYSEYMPPEVSENFNNYINESHSTVEGYAGIGASVQDAENGGIVIAELFEGSSGIQAGLKVGDIIIKVNGEDITQMYLSDVIDRIKGPENTNIVLTLVRNNQTMDITVLRKKVILTSYDNVTATTKDDIVWVKIRGFKTFAAEEFTEILKKNITPETKGIIIDLRYNPGGLLETAQQMLGEVLPAHSVACRLIEKGIENIYEVSGNGEFTDIPLVVFQNQYSASASEIFSAAIKDYERGSIIGTKSYGKGIAQNLFYLQRGTVKLTTAEFFSPLGNIIHKTGVFADIPLEASDDESYFEAAKKVFNK